MKNPMLCVPVCVNDQTNGLEEHSILGIRMLNFLGLWWLLSLVQYRLQTFRQSTTDSGVLCQSKDNKSIEQRRLPIWTYPEAGNFATAAKV